MIDTSEEIFALSPLSPDGSNIKTLCLRSRLEKWWG